MVQHFISPVQRNWHTLSESISNISSCDEEAEEASPLVGNLPRTHRLILDYKQFKAAQLIQQHVRDWLVRLRTQKFHLAAVVIQKWWRRYMAQRNWLVLAETTLQQTVLSLYNSSATIIQKVFRGWWTRNHVVDVTKIKALQTSMAEYIIHALGNHLHEVKLKALLPGVDKEQLPQECLETINELITTLDFRLYNSHSCFKMQKIMSEISDMRNTFKNSVNYTHVPFRGFDYRNDCGRCLSALEVKEEIPEDADLIRRFVCAKRDTEIKSKSKRKASVELARKSTKPVLDIAAPFFKRITNEMMNWRHANGDEVLPRTIFKIKDMKALLDEVKVNLEDIFEPCICGVPAEFADI